jgi:hypothetical protein
MSETADHDGAKRAFTISEMRIERAWLPSQSEIRYTSVMDVRLKKLGHI